METPQVTVPAAEQARTVRLYAGRSIDPVHIVEFFSRNFLKPNEEPLAMFDGIFYEGKNARMGGISFHDYLLVTNRSIYTWARGMQKDFLDRFVLSSVQISAVRKDDTLATLNLEVTRPSDKKKIYLIFDLVPTAQKDDLIKLHTLLMIDVEAKLGKDYLGEIPDGLAASLVEKARQILQPQEFVITRPSIPQFEMPETMLPPEPDMSYQPPYMSGYASSGGGTPNIYGDDALYRLKQLRSMSNASQSAARPNRYGQHQPSEHNYNTAYPPYGNVPQEGFGPNSLPSFDMVKLKRAEAAVKDALQIVMPDDVRKEAATKVNSLLSNPEKLVGQLNETLKAVNELAVTLTTNEVARNFVTAKLKETIDKEGIGGILSKAAMMIAEMAIPTQAASAKASQANKPEVTATNASGEQSVRKIKVRQVDSAVETPAAVISTPEESEVEVVLEPVLEAPKVVPERKAIKVKI
jgi:hypothetical protein